MAGVVVLDASALIALFDSADPHHNWALKMFRDTVEFDLALSVVTHAEVLVHPLRAGRESDFERSLQGLGVELIPLSADSGVQLAQLRAQTSLRMPDVVVLHSALNAAGSIATTDRGLAAAARALSVGVFQPC
jgi:predicted nucleic acid-binding protein